MDNKYKKSKYIISKYYKNGYILFHGYSGNIIFLTNKTYKLFVNDNFSDLDQNTFSSLKKQYFILDNEIDEKSIIQKVYDKFYSFLKNKVYLTFLMTYNCNFSCSYCYQRENGKIIDSYREIILDKNKIDKIFDFCENLKYLDKINSITLYGGEPFLKENKTSISYLLEKVKKYDIKNISAITNGYDIDFFDDVIKKEDYFISSLQITIDGPEHIHNKRRMLKNGEGTYKKITDNICYFLKKGIIISIRTNIDKNNISCINEIREDFKNKGYIKYKNFHFDFSPLLDNKFLEKENLINHRFLENYKLENNISNNYKYYKKIINEILENKKSFYFDPIACGALTNSFVFDPLGKIYKCWDFVGNEIFSIGQYFPEIKLKESDFNWDFRNNLNNINCGKCKYILICGCGCKALAFKKFNSLNYGYCTYVDKVFTKSLYDGFDEYINKHYND